MENDNFVLSIETKNINKDLKHVDEKVDFCKLHETYELFSYKMKKSSVNSKLKLLKIFGLINSIV